MPKSISGRTTCVDLPPHRQSLRPPNIDPGAWIVVVVIVAFAALILSGVPQEAALAGLASATTIGVRASGRILRLPKATAVDG